MSKTALIKVTADDIRGGRSDVYGCPVAIAFRRHLKTEKPYEVHAKPTIRNGEWVGIVTLADGSEYRLSQAVGRFMSDFDCGRPVKPFAFRVWL